MDVTFKRILLKHTVAKELPQAFEHVRNSFTNTLYALHEAFETIRTTTKLDRC